MLLSLIGFRVLLWKLNIWLRFEMYKGQKKVFLLIPFFFLFIISHLFEHSELYSDPHIWTLCTRST